MSSMQSEQIEAVQNVVDRIGAYQDGAPEGTVERELGEALGEAGISLTDDQVKRLADAVESADGRVEVADVLG